MSFAATCTVPELDNGLRLATFGICISSECEFNSTLIYKCVNTLHHEYVTVGSAVITCTEEGSWSPSLGTCVRGESFYFY